MKRYEMIKPVPGFKVWDPQTSAFLPECGRRVLYDQYWSRRQNDGAIEIIPTATAPIAKTAAPPVTKKAEPPITKKAPDPIAENGIAKKPGQPAAAETKAATKKEKNKTKNKA